MVGKMWKIWRRVEDGEFARRPKAASQLGFACPQFMRCPSTLIIYQHQRPLPAHHLLLALFWHSPLHIINLSTHQLISSSVSDEPPCPRIRER